MTLHLPRPHGRHRAADRVRELEADNARLTAENTDLACTVVKLTTQLDTAGIALTGAWSDLDKSVEEIRRLQQQHIGDAIEKSRLRRALHNARPRITTMPATAERPTAPDSVPQPHAA
ncbi:hypothetical protein [Streptomyces antimycoticus]